MAQNVTIAGASFSDVPSIVVPKTGGGTASFVDVSSTTAVASDVASGKIFYLSDGTQGVGTSSGGGGIDWDDFATRTVPSGEIYLTVTNIGDYAFPFRPTQNWKVYAPNVTSMGTSPFNNARKLKEVYLPKLSTSGYQTFYYASDLVLVDFVLISSIPSAAFQNTALNTLILRKSDGVATLSNVNIFNNSPFASGKAGGTLYVPSSLISSYQSASNWSTILGYPNNQIKKIEDSAYETPIS